MLVTRGAADLPASTDPDAVVTAHMSTLRTSFNTKKNPQSYTPTEWHKVSGDMG